MLGLDARGDPVSQGSGVVIDVDVVVSNCHVFRSSQRAVARYRDEQKPAALRHMDPDRDVCSFDVPGLGAPAAQLAETSTAKVGDHVFAIGAPRGLELTLSDGLVSSLRSLKHGRMLQVTAPISPGSSGGGLFDERARLIGLTTLFLEDSQQLNFAVPVEWIYELPARHEQLVRLRARNGGGERAARRPTEPERKSCSSVDSDYRRKYAEKWRDSFQRLNDQTPALSLAERGWLKNEYDDAIAAAGGRYTPRALAAMESRAYQLRVAKPHTTEIVNSLDDVLRASPVDAEVAARWTYAVSLLMDRSYWYAIEQLVEMGVVDPGINGVTTLYYENHVLWSQSVLVDVVLPCLGSLR